MTDKIKSSRLTRQFYKNLISYDDYSKQYPSDSNDTDIEELFYLVEHEPQKGGLLGLKEPEYDDYMADIYKLIYELEPVPNKIDGAKTLYYTDIDKRHSKTGNTRHHVDGQFIENISGLAICKYDNDPGYYLFACNEAWDSVTDTLHDSIEDAKRQAEFEFTNSIRTWRMK